MLTSLRPLYKVTCCQETITMQMSRNTFLLHRAMKKTSNAFIAFWKSQATLQNHLSASSRWLKAFHMKISIFKFLEQNGCEIIGYKSVFKSSAKEKNRCWLYYNIKCWMLCCKWLCTATVFHSMHILKTLQLPAQTSLCLYSFQWWPQKTRLAARTCWSTDKGPPTLTHRIFSMSPIYVQYVF